MVWDYVESNPFSNFFENFQRTGQLGVSYRACPRRPTRFPVTQADAAGQSKLRR